VLPVGIFFSILHIFVFGSKVDIQLNHDPSLEIGGMTARGASRFIEVDMKLEVS
jgi:hypothetical protein